MSIDSDLQKDYQYLAYFSGRTSTSEILQDFDHEIDQICKNNYKFNQEESNSVLFLFNNIKLNDSASAYYIGVEDEIFNKINIYQKNSDYLFLNISQNDTENPPNNLSFKIKIEDNSKIFEIENITQIFTNDLFNYSKSFANFLINDTILMGDNLFSVIITKISTYEYDLASIMITNPSFQYHFAGYQEIYNIEKYLDVIWSKNANKRLFAYFLEIQSNFEEKYTDLNIQVENSDVESSIISSEFFINITYFILRIIQIIVFVFPLLYLFIIVLQYYTIDKDFEQNEILRGQKRIERIINYFVEMLIIILSSAIISLILLFSYMKFENRIFSSPYEFEFKYYIISFSIPIVTLLSGLFISEFMINKSLKSDIDFDDSLKTLLFTMQKPIKISILIIVLLLSTFLLLEENDIIIISIIIGIGVIITLCTIISLFFKYMTSIIQKLIQIIHVKKNKNPSKTFLLFSFWKKYSFKKIFVISLIVLSFITINVGSTILVNIYRTNTMWNLGSTISVSCDAKNSSDFENYLNSNQQNLGLRNYVSYISIITDFNTTGSIYTSEYKLMGIDYQDWIDFYGKKEVLNLLESNEPDASLIMSEDSSILLSYGYKGIGYDLKDKFFIPYYNSSEEEIEILVYNVSAFVKNWPIYTEYPSKLNEIQSENSYFCIIQKDILIELLNTSMINYKETFLLDVENSKINETSSLISKEFSSFEVYSVDLSGFIGVEQLQSSLLFQIFQFCIIFGSLALYFDYINVSSVSKRKSIILAQFGLVSDYRKILRNTLILEWMIFMLSYLFSLLVAYLIVNYAVLLISGISITYIGLMLKNTLFLAFLLSCSLILYQYLEYRKFAKLKIRDLFRYPE
ncbi:hypothetical protein [Candidatus Harpocratesius sp.]